MKQQYDFQNNQYKNIFVLEAKMENRTCEEIAKDFADQIADLADKLIEQKRNRCKEGIEVRKDIEEAEDLALPPTVSLNPKN